MRFLLSLLVLLVGLHAYRAFSEPVSRIVIAATERVEVCRGGETSTLARYVATREIRRGRATGGACALSARDARREIRREAREIRREARRAERKGGEALRSAGRDAASSYRHAREEARDELRRLRDAARAEYRDARDTYQNARRSSHGNNHGNSHSHGTGRS